MVAIVGLVVVFLTVPGETSVSAEQGARRGTPPVTVDRVLTTGLVSPWGLAFLPDGSALVGERDTGKVLRIPAAGGPAKVVGRVQGSRPDGEGGLLGLAVPPGANPRYVFAYYTGAGDNRVVRIAWNGKRLGAQRPILTGIPYEQLTMMADDCSWPRTARSSWPPATLASPTGPRTPRAWPGRSCGSPSPVARRRATPTPIRRSTRSATATCRASRWTVRGRVWASEFGARGRRRAQPPAPGAQLRLARARGHGAERRSFVDPADAVVADVDRLAQRHRDPRRRGLRRQPARRGDCGRCR